MGMGGSEGMGHTWTSMDKSSFRVPKSRVKSAFKLLNNQKEEFGKIEIQPIDEILCGVRLDREEFDNATRRSSHIGTPLQGGSKTNTEPKHSQVSVGPRGPTPVFGRFPTPPPQAYIVDLTQPPPPETDQQQQQQQQQRYQQHQQQPSVRHDSLNDSASTLMEAIRNGQINLPKVEENLESLNPASLEGSASVLIHNNPARPSSVSPSESISVAPYKPPPDNSQQPKEMFDCVICGKVVVGATVNDVNPVHQACLTCKACGTLLDQQEFRVVDGHLFCEHHFDKPAVPKDTIVGGGLRSVLDNPPPTSTNAINQSNDDNHNHNHNHNHNSNTNNNVPSNWRLRLSQPDALALQSFANLEEFLHFVNTKKKTNNQSVEYSVNQDKNKNTQVQNLRSVTPSGTEWLTKRHIQNETNTKVFEQRVKVKNTSVPLYCSGCNKPVAASNACVPAMITFDSLKYHPACFKCSLCFCPLAIDSAHKLNNSLYCIHHYHSIRNKYTNNNNNNPVKKTHKPLPTLPTAALASKLPDFNYKQSMLQTRGPSIAEKLDKFGNNNHNYSHAYNYPASSVQGPPTFHMNPPRTRNPNYYSPFDNNADQHVTVSTAQRRYPKHNNKIIENHVVNLSSSIDNKSSGLVKSFSEQFDYKIDNSNINSNGGNRNGNRNGHGNLNNRFVSPFPLVNGGVGTSGNVFGFTNSNSNNNNNLMASSFKNNNLFSVTRNDGYLGTPGSNDNNSGSTADNNMWISPKTLFH
ncbi:hypothetical protein AX774_g5290 [Zancudomyces culisetae]|uniref:LIM zinc-binding domain-containing protein n=1 Tax=Zancudomyces culisetae TaxID=1213189 RepID=A0A1R1PJW5_ZANCU|nr:hypothetical protein AX774_g5290 [Zancudomyces culisetae]|eukprot:OMH81258.1 hypothetical protein AX774_g5290 [Zancudomyces culisetae]